MSSDPWQLGEDRPTHFVITQPTRRRDTHPAIRRIDSEIHVLDPFAHDLNDQVVHVDLLLYHSHAAPTIQHHSEWEEYTAFFSMGDSPGGGIFVVRAVIRKSSKR